MPTIPELIDRITELEEENRQLRELIEPEKIVGHEFGMTRTEAAIFERLMRYGMATNGVLHDVIMAMNGTSTEPRIVQVYISKIREKLKGSQYKVVTLWGRGYRLEQAK